MERVFIVAKCVQTHRAITAGTIYAFHLEEINGGRLRINAVSGQTETYDSTVDFLIKYQNITCLGEVEDQDEIAKLARGYKASTNYEHEDLWG